MFRLEGRNSVDTGRVTVAYNYGWPFGDDEAGLEATAADYARNTGIAGIYLDIDAGYDRLAVGLTVQGARDLAEALTMYADSLTNA